MRVHKMEQRRRGVMAPLAALIIAFLIGMVAFAVDVGWIVLTKDQLQNAADAAALAGADPLMDALVQYQLATTNNAKTTILNTAIASAKTNAKNYASYNRGGEVSNLTLLDSDIEFGFTNASGVYATPAPAFPNTVRVTIRRDSTANGALALFFAPVIGRSSENLTATASATIMSGSIDSFSFTTPNTLNMLPMTYDVAHWNNFLNTGQDPDGGTNVAANGLPELQVYPSTKAPGNFGQLSLDDSHVGASTESGWVDSGMSAADLAALKNSSLVPLSSHKANTWDWQGDTGFKASLVMTVNNHTNSTYVLPLFQAYSSGPSYSAGVGQGANYNYDIVQFVGIKIMPVDSSNRQVVIQPVAYMNPFATFTNLAPAGTQSSLVTTFAAPKLSR